MVNSFFKITLLSLLSFFMCTTGMAQAYTDNTPPPRRAYRPGMGGVKSFYPANPTQTHSAPSYTPPVKKTQSKSNDVDPTAVLSPENKPADQTLKQKGTAMFKPEDEKKVAKFDVKNEEFEKLSDQEKADLLKKVIVDKKNDDERKRFGLQKRF